MPSSTLLTALEIREALKEDSQNLEDFLAFIYGEKERALAKKYITCMFSDDLNRPLFIVAEDESGIIGAASISEEMFTVGTWGISWVSVHPDRRNQGIGEILINACMDKISKIAGQKVTVIIATYPDKTGLYDRLGFAKAGQDHEGGWYMLKILNVEAS